MFDKYLEEKMIIRIQIWRDVFIHYLDNVVGSNFMATAMDKADEAVKRFDQASKETPE